MTRFLLSTVLFFSFFIGFGQCPNTNITLTSQEEVDNFAIDYPNCTAAFHSFTIEGSNINSLAGLNVLTQANSIVISNTSVVNLEGLDNITYLGTLSLLNNTELESIDNLSSLTELLILAVVNNDNLESIAILEQSEVEMMSAFIGDNGSLESLIGLAGFDEFGSIEIYNNNALLNLAGLEQVERLGTVRINDNENLESLEGLNNLLVGSSLEIRNNPELNDISAVSNVQLFEGGQVGSPGDLTIRDNTSLSECSIISVCSFIRQYPGQAVVSNNSSNCNTPVEIEVLCPTCPTSDVFLSSQQDVNDFPNTYPGCSVSFGNL